MTAGAMLVTLPPPARAQTADQPATAGDADHDHDADHGDGDEHGPAARPLTEEERAAVDEMRSAANAKLLHGEFDRARREFEKILKVAPGDAAAQREAARAAQAAGEFEYAAEALERAHHFERHRRDPELHYLRGEALFVLNRNDEAAREHRIAELEIGPYPTDRMEKLWLARVHARRGRLDAADRIYDSMWPPAPRFDSEVALNQADAHLMNKDWAGGAKVLRRYLERDPKSTRGREMLAWALETTGDLDGELAVRASLAGDVPTPANRNDYGRALERASEFAGARDQYEGALQAGADPAGTVATSALRMRLRTTPEVAGGFVGRSDPQASALRAQVGGALPFGQRHSLMLLAWRDDSRGGFPSATGSVTGMSAGAQLATRSGTSLVLAGDVRYGSAEVASNGVVLSDRQIWRAGAQAEVDSTLGSHAQVNLHTDYNEQWAESPVTIQEGGVSTGLTGHLYLFPRSRRVLLDAGTQLRRLGLAPRDEERTPTANQALFFAGADAVLWASPTRLLRGEALDERLVRRTYLNDAGVLSYRHYQLFTDSEPEFGSRIALAPRAAIDNLSMVIRKAMAGGRVGLDLHGGGGYDSQRERVLSQAGAAVLIAPSWSSRLSLSYDMARETATGLSGTLHTGWVSYHVDL
ncbi:MAG TPA: tetratricopeptide repeat protein [Polyangia bacterium]|nr:tetratricopeptide repeat protein [Polyangia bacterium]